MAIRNLNTTLRTSLLNNDPFNYAHLVKFERPVPYPLGNKKASRNASTYTYVTDGAFDIVWDDGSKNLAGASNLEQTYNANKLGKIGNVTETTEAKASTTTITLDTSALGATASVHQMMFQSNTITGPVGFDFVAEGFSEGDKIYIVGDATAIAANNQQGEGVARNSQGIYVTIDTFKDEGRGFRFTEALSSYANAFQNYNYTISLASEEIESLTADKTSGSYSTYMNREVFIYKAHMDIDTNAIIGEPYLIFKGIISNGQIKEDPGKSSSIIWTLSSHWGDFSRVSGRLTVDEAHRALDGSGEPDPDAVIRKEYIGDLGFAHANQSLSVMALYNEIEIGYKQVDINGGWPGGKRLREVENTVERRTDLNFNLSPKYLPVAYGVNKLDAIPVFVDTANTDASEIYVAYAMCEGQIGGLLDLYIDDNSSICVDKADSDLRSTASENIDLVCTGRMDRGNALGGYNANTNANITGHVDHEGFRYNFGRGGGPFSTVGANFRKPKVQGFSVNSTGTDTAGGLQHNRTHTINSPITGHFQFHAGKPDQAANSTLVGKAASNGFKIQNDYYEDANKNTYWTNQHQLLDTAYVVSRFTIAAGETSIPEIDFVVRGKGVECHNYDRTYNNTNVVTTPVTTHTSFNLGDTVYLRDNSSNAITGVNNAGSTVTSATQIIIDKWAFLDINGVTQYRFKTDWNYDITTNFYMQRTSDAALKWYAAPVVSTSAISGTVANASKTTISSTSSNSSTGIDVVVAQNAAFEAAQATLAAIGIGGESGALGYIGAVPGLEIASFYDTTYNASSNTVQQVGTSTSQTLASTITHVFVKDAIILNSTAQANGFYTGMAITLSRTDSAGNAYIQKRTIVGYTNAGNVAIVDIPWDEGYFPDTGDTYVISAGRPDVRVSINPAMQLLDYLTSSRYGANLDIDLDIDLETFKQAARDCDTKSDVTIIASTAPTVGHSYEYAPSGVLHFRGKVLSVTTIVADINADGTNETYYEVVFTDAIGKLGRKWNDWESFRPNELIWKDKTLYKKTTALSTYAISSSNIITAQNLTKVGASGTTLALNLNNTNAGTSANGNPIVKSVVPASTARGISFNASGYTLYDSDDVKYWKYIGWDSNAQTNVTRHQMNQVISTSNPVFDNINLMLKQFNGILRFSNGLYALDIKGQTPITFVNGETINEEDIIGSVSVKDGGLKKSYNSVSSSIKDPQTKFEGRSVSFFNSVYLKQDKSIPKKGSYGMPGITNYYNARFNVNQYLDESRYGLSVSFKMMPKGILLLPGSIIKLSYERFGWVNKELRISNLVMGPDCLVNVTAEEHNNDAYVIKKISQPTIGEAISTAAPVNLNTPTPPTNLAGAGKVPGTFVLTWTNSTEFNLRTHTTEVYVNTTHNDKAHANTKLIAKGIQVERYDHTVEADTANTTQYFWVKHVVSRITNNGPRDIHSLFSPNTTAGISTVAPIRHKGKWNIAVSSLPTTATLANTRWGDGSGARPATLVVGDEAWFFTGNQNAPTGQKIWQYTGSTWTEITQAIRGDVMVDGSVTTTEIADGTILADNIDQTASAGKFGEVVAALGTFTQVDTDVLNANSVIAREVQVFPAGATPPTISGTTLAGAGIDLKKDGDMYVGNAATNKYMFWDQSAGTMTFRGTLNVDDITGSSAKFSTLMAEVATIGTLNTEMLDSDAIVTRDIRVGPSVETNAGSFATGTEYYITVLGNTTQAQWNSVAGTSGVVYNLGGIFTAANAGTGTGKARNRTTVAKIANTTLTGSGAHLNAAGDFYVGNASTNKYMFWDQSAGTMTLRGELNADDITAGTIDATTINVNNLSSLSANLGNVTAGTLSGGTVPEATSAPTGTEAGAFLDLGVGRMVLGNASKYIWWDGTNLTINGVTISNSTLQSATGVATETYVNTAISNLVDTAPSTLDTLNELAAALGDDPNFATSVSTSLGNKVSTTSHQALSANANAMTISGSTITLTRGDSSTDTVAVPNDNTEYTAGSGLALSGTTFSNSAPDRTVAISAGSNISVSGTYPNFSIASTNTNTQRTDEEIRDVAASIITAGTNVSVAKNDAANTVTISSTDTVFTHPAYTARSINTSGATVLDTFTSDAIGSVTGIGTRTLTLANLGYTGATNANLYVLPGSVVHNTESQALNSNPLRISGSTLSLYKGDGSFDSVTLPSVSPANNTITVSAGVGLSGGGAFTLNQGSDETITLTAHLSELPDMTQTFASTDELVVLDAGVSKRKQASEISLSKFHNDLTFTAATTLGGQNASHYLNVNTTFGGDVSGTYNAISIADDSHNHIISNVDGLQTALNGKVDDNQVLTNVPTGALFTDTNTQRAIHDTPVNGATTTSISSNWAFDNVKTSVPTGAVFTDTNTNYFLNGISKSGNTLTFSVSGSTNQSFAFGANAFTSHSAPHYTSAIVSSDVTGALGFTPGTSSLALGTSSSTALAGNTSIPQGDITAITVSAPITGGGTTGSVGIAITQSSGSANGYLSSTDWTTFNNKSTFNGAYGSLSGRPTIPSGNQIINWTTDQGATNIHANNYLNTNTTNFGIRAEAGAIENISAGEAVTFRGAGATTVSRSGNNIDISSTNTDRYVNSASFNSSNGVLTLTRAGSDTAAVTVNLDGRYATVNDTGTPAILSNGSSPSLNSGISAAEVRSAIGAGTSNLAIGTTSTTALAGNTNLTSGVQTVTVGSNVGGIIVGGGATATATLSVHATLEGIADGVPISNLDVDFLKADTIVANKIDANEITMNKLKTAPVSGQGTVEIGTAGIRILDSSGNLRVAIGNLSRLATNHNNA